MIVMNDIFVRPSYREKSVANVCPQPSSWPGISVESCHVFRCFQMPISEYFSRMEQCNKSWRTVQHVKCACEGLSDCLGAGKKGRADAFGFINDKGYGRWRFRLLT